MRLIDADAEIEAIKKYACKDCESYNGIRCRACWADDLISWIEDAPKVDAVEVAHGRWAALDDDCEELEGEEEAMRWGCSACREIVEYADWTHRSFLTRYCPNCGAKMDGDGND